MAATMSDVARRAGVTKQTVSNVVTGRVRVGPDTARRVRAAIEELGYTPNLVARSLATGSTMTVGVFVPTVAGSFYAELLEEVEDALHARGYHLLLCTTRMDGERAGRQLAAVSSRSVDALFVAGDRNLIDRLPLLAHARFPVVLCAWETEVPDGYPVVTLDYAEAGRLAGRHLRGLGHTRVAVLAGAAHGPRVEGFREGFRADPGHAAASQGPVSIGVHRAPEPGAAGGFAAARAAFAADPEVTALFATHDLLAFGALEAARAAGRSVPGDLSIVGHDDVPEARLTWPPLTSVAVPTRRMAREAVELLLRAITDPAAAAPATRRLQPELVARESSAPPRGR